MVQSIEKSDFENVKEYGKYLLPYIFVGVYDNIENNFRKIEILVALYADEGLTALFRRRRH